MIFGASLTKSSLTFQQNKMLQQNLRKNILQTIFG